MTHVGAGAKKGPGRLNRAKYGPPRWEDLQLRAQSSGRISQFVVHDDDDIPVARMEADIIIGAVRPRVSSAPNRCFHFPFAGESEKSAARAAVPGVKRVQI